MKRTAEEIESLLRELSSHGLGGLNPDAGQLRALIEADRSGPLQFLNLLRYRNDAQYPPGHDMAERNLSGADAYAIYGAAALKHVGQRGGRLTLLNDVEQDIIGDGAGWHQIAVMEYPSTDAFLDMVRDPDYTAALVHRDAGLEKTVVLVTRPLLPPVA